MILPSSCFCSGEKSPVSGLAERPSLPSRCGERSARASGAAVATRPGQQAQAPAAPATAFGGVTDQLPIMARPASSAMAGTASHSALRSASMRNGLGGHLGTYGAS